MDNLSLKILSDLIIHMKYSRYLEKEKRRETWEEIVTRNMKMHIKKFPNLEEEIRENYKYVFDKKVLPSMRALQFGGKPIEINPIRQYNCTGIAVNHSSVFGEIMFLLLAGSGVGISVQKHHIEELPPIRKPLNRKKRFLISDSCEGWAESVKVLMDSYFFNKSEPNFDFRDIREKGSKLVTSGGKAPGPKPLKDCLYNIKGILDDVETGNKLTPIQVHDIICIISDAVLSGGIRRSSLISIFSLDDEEMLTAKSGRWWETNPYRSRSNNSAMILRHRIKKQEFYELWDRMKNSGFGEPAFLFSNDSEMITNPCGETALRASGGACNLTEINVGENLTQEEFNQRCKVASFIGTIQSSYTDFHYLRDCWTRNIEKEALLGISMTGICGGNVLKLNLAESANICVEENKRVSKLLNINPSMRLTLVKPSGTSSLVLGTSAGIHAWHSPYYIRRMRVMKNEVIYEYLKNKIPELIEDDFEKPSLGAVISIPIKAPENAIFRDEPVLNMLERIKKVYDEWIISGHIKGNNTHNVSCTISVKNDDWDGVRDWLWENKEHYNSITVLPYFCESYKQMPLEEISEEKYEEMMKYVKEIDLSEIIEEEDGTKIAEEFACSGKDSCEIRDL